VLFTRKLYNNLITCPSLLGALRVRVPLRNILDFNTFYTSFSRDKYPSVHCAVAVNEIYNISISDSHYFW
jgi:hypothetical protein